MASKNIKRWTDCEQCEIIKPDMANPKLIEWRSFYKLKAQGNIFSYLEAENKGHDFHKKENEDFHRMAVI